MDWVMQEMNRLWDFVSVFFAFDTARLLEPGIIAALVLQIILFGLSAFFSGSETALFSLSRLDLQKLRRDRHPQSETLHALLDQPRRLIISILCGNELVNIAATANLAGILVYLYGEGRAGWINVLVMFPLLLLFGEVTPKTIAVSDPVRLSAGLVAAPLNLWAKLITPLRRVVRAAADRITTWIVGQERARENILRMDEFRTLLDDVADEGVLDATERVLIDNLLEASETEIVEIMTPRTRIDFLKDDMSVREMLKRFRQIQHPRVPVCHEHHDNLVGFVHGEDVVRLVFDDTDLSKLKPDDIMHPPVVVPPTKNVDEMFDFFQANNARAAAVLNEFGGVEGFITMRDVISFIFGEISGSIAGQELYRERDQNVYEVAGQMKLTDFNDLTNFGIEDPRMTTIGGVVFRYLDRLPKVGDRVVMDGYVATVLEMDGHRLARVRVAKGALEEESGGEGPAPDSEQETKGEDDGRSADKAVAKPEEEPSGEGPAPDSDQKTKGEDDGKPADKAVAEPGKVEPESAEASRAAAAESHSAEVVDLATLKRESRRKKKSVRKKPGSATGGADEERG